MTAGKFGYQNVAIFGVFLFFHGIFFSPPAWAESKIFSGAGDGTSWQVAENWSPVESPGAGDAITIDLKDAVVSIIHDFQAQSVYVGGRTASTLEAQSFVFGTITPVSNTDNALWIRNGGYVVLKQAGVITLKGTLKFSNETLPDEPSPMVVLK